MAALLSLGPTVSFADYLHIRNEIVGTDPASERYFGLQVEIIGDVNDDGVQDIAVAGFNWASEHGIVRMYSGVDGVELWSRQGADNTFLGTSVTEIADIDGDGREDVVVGRPGDDYVFAYSGADGQQLWSARGPNDLICGSYMIPTHRGFGGALASGDFDGDGEPEVAVSQVGQRFPNQLACSNHGWTAGKYVYFVDRYTTGAWGLMKNSEGDTVRILVGNRDYLPGYTTVYSSYHQASAGDWLANLGDSNGDGKDELLIGYPHWNDDTGCSRDYAGRIMVYQLGLGVLFTDLGDKCALNPSPDSNNNYLGASVASAGDLNNDGITDFLAGAPGEWHGYGDDVPRGYVRLYQSGGGTLNWTVVHEWVGAEGGSRFGRSVRAISDPTASGQTKYVLIGRPGHEFWGGFAAPGKAYLFHAEAPYDTCQEFSDGGSLNFAYSVDTRFDHSDPVPLFAVGAPDAGTYGKVYWYRVLKSPLAGPDEGPVAVLSFPAPNPFSRTSTLALSLEKSAPVWAGVFDVTGRLIRILADGRRDSGDLVVQWDGRRGDGSRAPTGVYFLHLQVGAEVRTHKVTIVR